MRTVMMKALAIAVAVCCSHAAPPAVSSGDATLMKVTVPDHDGCFEKPDCVTTTYYHEIKSTCSGRPIYQDAITGNVLYSCNNDNCPNPPGEHHNWTKGGWCTGPAERIADCCGGCCHPGDHFLQNRGCTVDTPDQCGEHSGWVDCTRIHWNSTNMKGCLFAPNVTVELVPPPPPPPPVYKLTVPDHDNCWEKPDCVTTTYYHEIKSTCSGRPIYQDIWETGHVLYSCNNDNCPDGANHKWPKGGWCTGPVERIDDCCGGCCHPGEDHFLNNRGCTGDTPDSCNDPFQAHGWVDCTRFHASGKACVFAPNVTIELQ